MKALIATAFILSIFLPHGGSLATPCGGVEEAKVCLGEIDPRNKLSTDERRMLETGASIAIDTLQSSQFRKALDRQLAMLRSKDSDVAKWESAQESFGKLSAGDIIKRLLEQIDGMKVDSFGYTKGTFYWWFFGTKAFDGKTDGPIELNRAALYKATEYSLANTIVHEAAHRIGLRHDNKDECEAPYLIGDLLQSQVDQGFELPCNLG